MKQKVLILALGVSVGANIHFMMSEQDDALVDQVNFKQAAIKKEISPIARKPEKLTEIKNDVLDINDNKTHQLKKTEIEKEKYIDEGEIDKAKEAWNQKATDFLGTNIGLSDDQIQEFLQLNTNRLKELDEYMRNRMESNGGDQFFYTVEDIVDENKINIKYLIKLQALLGADGYEQYKEFRNEYNQSVIDSGHGFFLIDL